MQNWLTPPVFGKTQKILHVVIGRNIAKFGGRTIVNRPHWPAHSSVIYQCTEIISVPKDALQYRVSFFHANLPSIGGDSEASFLNNHYTIYM